MGISLRSLCGTVVAGVVLSAAASPMYALQYASVQVVSAMAIPHSALMQPEELNLALQKGHGNAPLVLQVGSQVMFEQGHIPGAVFAGPAIRPEGVDLLRKRVATLPRDKFIVIYCGCCPWSRCPNMGTAFQFLHGMGFTKVKALYLRDNFGANWIARGYRVEK